MRNMNQLLTIFALIQISVFSCLAENLLLNFDFETGTLNDWNLFGNDRGLSKAVLYSEADGFGSILPLTPPFAGGDFGAFLRADSSEIGFEQTVSVVAGEEYSYSLNFAVREVQIPGDPRQEQTVILRLNGNEVESQLFPAITTSFGNFQGTLTPTSNELTFTALSIRNTNFAFGNGQFFIDNAILDGIPGATIPEPSTWVLMFMVIGGLGFVSNYAIKH